MRVGIMPGSFNPAHIGHLEVLKSAIVEAGLDEALILPFRQSPRKKGVPQICLREKIRLCTVLAGDHPQIAVFDYSEDSLPHDTSGFRAEVIFLWNRVQERYRERGHDAVDFHVIVGSDAIGAISSFAAWVRWLPPIMFRSARTVLSGKRFIISPRLGDPIAPPRIFLGGGFGPVTTTTLPRPLENFSSSRIRAALARGEADIPGLPRALEASLVAASPFRGSTPPV